MHSIQTLTLKIGFSDPIANGDFQRMPGLPRVNSSSGSPPSRPRKPSVGPLPPAPRPAADISHFKLAPPPSVGRSIQRQPVSQAPKPTTPRSSSQRNFFDSYSF
jgi:hypothetical protein